MNQVQPTVKQPVCVLMIKFNFLSSETDLNPQGHKVEIPNEGKNLLHVNVLVVLFPTIHL